MAEATLALDLPLLHSRSVVIATTNDARAPLYDAVWMHRAPDQWRQPARHRGKASLTMWLWNLSLMIGVKERWLVMSAIARAGLAWGIIRELRHALNTLPREGV